MNNPIYDYECEDAHTQFKNAIEEFYANDLSIGIVGGSGGIGSELSAMLKPHSVTKYSSADVNLRNIHSILQFIDNWEHDVLIHLAVESINSPIHKLEISQLIAQLETNVKGLTLLLSGVVRKMREKKFGRIILSSSILSQRPVRGAGIYSASKAYMDNLVKTVAIENGKYGITCNSLQLGYFNVGLIKSVPEPLLSEIKNKIPCGELGDVTNIANMVKAIIDSPYINGSNIVVDGGVSLV